MIHQCRGLQCLSTLGHHVPSSSRGRFIDVDLDDLTAGGFQIRLKPKAIPSLPMKL